jgi:hypothetical protein
MKKLITCIVLLIMLAECKDKYVPSIASPLTGYLVVEGFISSSKEPTTISLSRTTGLIDAVNVLHEHNAVINIESEDHETFPLSEIGNGDYESASLSLNSTKRYRINIKTQDGREYASDFTALRSTPGIDSISWKIENDGLRLYVNTHDPQKNSKYYLWKYKETWEIHSTYLSNLKYLGWPHPYIVYRLFPSTSPDLSIYKCWQEDSSKTINIGTSEKLTEDRIFLPLLFIPPGSERLSVLYSINVHQFALSHDAYMFYSKMKRNTEQLGSIFDPQPSDLQGNIHCVTNPDEPVVGFVDVLEEKNLRVFISNADIPGWGFRAPCTSIYDIANDEDSILKAGPGIEPIEPIKLDMRGNIARFSAADIGCVDCTTRGTNVKPSFWP